MSRVIERRASLCGAVDWDLKVAVSGGDTLLRAGAVIGQAEVVCDVTGLTLRAVGCGPPEIVDVGNVGFHLSVDGEIPASRLLAALGELQGAVSRLGENPSSARVGPGRARRKSH